MLVNDWIGGLPPSAHERIARQRASDTAGSLFSAPAAASARSAGLAPVGEVFGCLVMNLGYTGYGCGMYGMRGLGGGPLGGFGMNTFRTPVLVSGGGSNGWSGFGPYVSAFRDAWQGALDRMLREAGMLGAEGVVGVTMQRSRIDGQAWEFTATGTAVRSVDTSLVPRPESSRVWAASFSAEDCAAAILSGQVPKGIALGLSVSTKHEDYQLRQQRSSWSNTEVDGLSDLLHAARDDARVQLARRATPFGGTDIVITDSTLTEFETPCGEEHDLHAESSFIGTILAPGPMNAFRTRGRPGSADVLTVIPLKGSMS